MMSNLELLNESEEDVQWLEENFLKLQEQHANKLVAIKKKKVVAAARNIGILLAELRKLGINEEEVLIEPIASKNEITVL